MEALEIETTTELLDIPVPSAASIEDVDPNKIYEYELVKVYNAGKPTDKETGKPLGAPYPKTSVFPNAGLAYDEKTGMTRKWRFITGQNSIWEDEQKGLSEYKPNEIMALLALPENQIEFIWGKCLVKGHEKLKRQALELSERFEGKKGPRVTSLKVEYRLLDNEAILNSQLELEELEYKAKKHAHEAKDEQMLAGAFALGINTLDQSKAGMNQIRSKFLNRAKLDPTNPKSAELLQQFIDTMESPATMPRYVFAMGLDKSILATTQVEGKLTYAMTREQLVGIPKTKNTVEYLTGIYLKEDHKENKIVGSVYNNVLKTLRNLKQ